MVWCSKIYIYIYINKPEGKLGKKDNFLTNQKKDEFQQTDKMLSLAYNF